PTRSTLAPAPVSHRDARGPLLSQLGVRGRAGAGRIPRFSHMKASPSPTTFSFPRRRKQVLSVLSAKAGCPNFRLITRRSRVQIPPPPFGNLLESRGFRCFRDRWAECRGPQYVPFFAQASRP